MKCEKRFSNLIGAGEGNRTLVLGSASQRTTTMLHLQYCPYPCYYREPQWVGYGTYLSTF